MQIKSFRHTGVLEDGTFESGVGAVETKGKIVMSQEDGGCSADGCTCSNGHWISIIKPRTEDGVVEGVQVTFDDYFEMKRFLANGEIIGTNNN